MGAVSEFILRMNDQVSGNAALATTALAKLEQKINSEQESLGGLNDKAILAGRALQQMQVGNTDGKLDDKIDKAKLSLEGLQRKIQEKQSGIGMLEGAKPAIEAAGASAETLGGRIKAMASEMQNANGVTGKLTAALKSLGPEGAAVAAVIATVVAVVTVAATTLWGWVEAAVAAGQKRDALIATFDALGGGAGAGEKTLAATSKLAAQLPYVTSQVNAWAKSLEQAQVKGAAMEKGVRAIAASAAITQTAGAAAESLIKRWSLMAETGQKVKLDRRQLSALSESGVDLDYMAKLLGTTSDKLGKMSLDAKKLGDAMQTALIDKGGPALENVGLTWDSIKAKFSEGIGSIFAGMGDAVRPLMVAIKDLFSEFNKGSTTTAAAGGMMKAFLTEVFAIATKVVDGLHKGFLYVEIGILHAAIALLPLGRAIKAIGANQYVIDGVKAAMVGLAVPIVVVVAAFAALVAIGGVVLAALGLIVGAVVAAAAWLEGAALDMGSRLIHGLVNGITAGVGAVVGAVKGLGHAAASAFTGFFGIRSPSRLMFDYGLQLPAGAAGGVEAGTDDVVDAVGGMSRAGADAASAGGGAGKSGGGKTFYITNHFNGVGEDVVEKIQSTFREMLEVARGESASSVLP